MREYPIGVIVLTDTFVEGDRIIATDSARNGYLSFFKATDIDVKHKIGGGKEFLKIIFDEPVKETISTGVCMLRDIKPLAFFSHAGIKYKKSTRAWNTLHCPHYIGIKEADTTVYAIIPRNTDGTYSEVNELCSWMNEHTFVQPEI